MRREDIILYDHRGRPLRWWADAPGYSRAHIGFMSPEAREKLDGKLGRGRDERPFVCNDEEEAEGIWVEPEEEEGEEG